MPKGIVKVWDSKQLPNDWFKRAGASDDRETSVVEERVRRIIKEVRDEKDQALFNCALRFDGAKLDKDTIKVSQQEIKAAYNAVSSEQVTALKLIKERLQTREEQVIRQENANQLETTKDGINVKTVLCPLESVGCYVPGGLATYPSSLLMTAVPAKAAGVKRVAVCSPVKGQNPLDPLVLVAADLCGVSEIYKIGGAQAIAALAYGTESIVPVKKIVGPGNKYVMIAKTIVSQDVAIDAPAGPSEVLVLADETADPCCVAADMISQAEHTPDSASGLITTSKKLAAQVQECIEKMTAKLERVAIAEKSLSTYGFIVVCDSTKEMVELANVFAPEHLEIITANPQGVADQITSAGLILIGAYTPVALSDYASGTNHVLPTGGFAKSFSGLSSMDFMRRVNVVTCSKAGLENVKETIKVITDRENLPNHYKAVEARFQK